MELHPPVDLAPMQGMTTPLQQTLLHQFFGGMDRFFLPFVKIQKNPGRTAKKLKKRFPPYNPKFPQVPQILSNDAEEFLILDRALHALGYPGFNWNLGCPAPTVTGKKRGAGLLPFPDKIKAVLDAVFPRLRCALSIKTRLGLNRPDELTTLLPLFNQYPLQELIIHPRLGSQLYRGHIDLPTFSECLAASRHPVTYNGDIFNLETFGRLQSRFPGVKRWMLGRGILANPFLPGQLKGRSVPAAEKLSRLRAFHDEYARSHALILSGPAHLLDKLKALWEWLHFIFPGGGEFYRSLLRAKRLQEYGTKVDRFFAQAPPPLEHLELVSENFS